MTMHPKQIIEHVARYYHVQLRDIHGPARTKHIVQARQMAMYMIRLLLPTYSLKEIAIQVGRVDHTTTLHAMKRVIERTRVDGDVRNQISVMTDTLTSAPELPALVDV